MKKKLFVALFAIIFVSACGGNDSENNASIDPGERAYQNNCALCHGGDLSGKVGTDLRGVGSKFTADEILTIINDGYGDMPAGRATGEDAVQIANWLAEQK